MRKVVFDFDGTLLDSSERHTVLLNDICLELGLSIGTDGMPADFSDYLGRKKRGLSTKQYLMKRCGFSEELAENCASLWIARIEARQYLSRDKLFPDAVKLLEQLYNQYQLILISARQQEQLLFEQVARLNIHQYFTGIYCVSPADAVVEKARVMARYSMGTEAMVGDTEADWKAAQWCGIPFYALYRGFRGAEFWAEQGITAYPDLSCLNELLH